MKTVCFCIEIVLQFLTFICYYLFIIRYLSIQTIVIPGHRHARFGTFFIHEFICSKEFVFRLPKSTVSIPLPIDVKDQGIVVQNTVTPPLSCVCVCVCVCFCRNSCLCMIHFLQCWINFMSFILCIQSNVTWATKKITYVHTNNANFVAFYEFVVRTGPSKLHTVHTTPQSTPASLPIVLDTSGVWGRGTAAKKVIKCSHKFAGTWHGIMVFNDFVFTHTDIESYCKRFATYTIRYKRAPGQAIKGLSDRCSLFV